MISNPDTVCDPDTDPDPEDFWLILPQSNGSTEGRSLFESRSQRRQLNLQV
jgi:hypothetical protein